jgi:transposase
MTMPRRDARSLDHETLEEMRRLAVRRVEAGESQTAVAASLEVNKHTVSTWMRAFREGGATRLASTKSSGRPPALDERQLARLKRIIVGKTPDQLDFGSVLWTLPIVQETIRRMFDVALHATTVGRILERLGLTPQKPVRRAFQRDDEACERWASTEFPALVRAVKRKQGTLLFLDEAGVNEDGPVGTTWALRGQRPAVKTTGSRRRVNVISAISPRGRLWFRCFKGTLTAQRFVEFLRAMLREVRGHITLVLDKHPAHVAAATRRFVEASSHRLRIEFLPSYAPDMNPDEHVWSYLKGLFRREPLHPDEDFADIVNGSMILIRNSPRLVRAFFGHPEVAYVRDALKW